MIELWNFYWPVFTAATLIGLVAGWLAFRPGPPGMWPAIAVGIALSLAAAALWHGPLGTGDRFASKIEAAARIELDYIEMNAVAARLKRGPLERTLVLDGPADDFQRRELPRHMSYLPGVGRVRWAARAPAGAAR